MAAQYEPRGSTSEEDEKLLNDADLAIAPTRPRKAPRWPYHLPPLQFVSNIMLVVVSALLVYWVARAGMLEAELQIAGDVNGIWPKCRSGRGLILCSWPTDEAL